MLEKLYFYFIFAGDVAYTLYVMSNTYVGIDQQFDIHLRIIT